MLIVGEGDRDAARAAKSIHTRIEKMRDDPPTDPKERDLFYLKPNTTLQGTRLINAKAFPLRKNIALFIDWRLVRKADNFSWTNRLDPRERN